MCFGLSANCNFTVMCLKIKKMFFVNMTYIAKTKKSQFAFCTFLHLMKPKFFLSFKILLFSKKIINLVFLSYSNFNVMSKCNQMT